MDKQQIVLCNELEKELLTAIESNSYDKLFVLTDEHTAKYCLPRLNKFLTKQRATSITIPAGDINKNIETLSYIWNELGNKGASRHSLLINLGGGMITDLGGFAAATFKRGIRYINIPTTLLAMVDASIGGKTGINFNGLKNEIGVFAPASHVLIESDFLRTLDTENFFSGYAEMLKHGLISSISNWADLLNFSTDKLDYQLLKQLVGKSVHIKEEIVGKDPFEQGIRKALNLGHTVGHAFESLSFEQKRPVLHGYAVAWGTVCELYLSSIKCGFPTNKLQQTVRFVRENYGIFIIDCKVYDQLYTYMLHDKKNNNGVINFTLLQEVGSISINQTATKEEVFEMLDFYRECMGC